MSASEEATDKAIYEAALKAVYTHGDKDKQAEEHLKWLETAVEHSAATTEKQR